MVFSLKGEEVPLGGEWRELDFLSRAPFVIECSHLHDPKLQRKPPQHTLLSLGLCSLPRADGSAVQASEAQVKVCVFSSTLRNVYVVIET